MTDKELRKLSRLELLELLLTESRENDRLKEEVERLKSEKSISQTAEQLEQTVKQLNEILSKTGSVKSEADLSSDNTAEDTVQAQSEQHGKPDTTQEGKIQSDEIKPDEKSSEDAQPHTDMQKRKKSKDAEIYERLIVFFYRNTEAMSLLPYDLYFDIMTRIKEIVSGQN